MRQTSAFILLVIFMFNSAVKISFTTWFYANQEKIAATHCINKDKIEIKCKGCCHLVSTLSKMDNGKTEPAPNIPNNTLNDEHTNWFCADHSIQFDTPFSEIESYGAFYLGKLSSSNSQENHPPPEV